ncbi:hypothetical protein ABIA33_001448 [Streptacidiphilus sp. MAP12-16]|uniref:hypothetical protein n=1 Tax=Streptacidiphilus sp. MAP12-16 TaxID=3156300 RepID=UPI0035185334
MDITDGYVMWAGQNYGNAEEGINWYHQGCFSDVENSYGSVRGRAGGYMDERDVHVFLRDGLLAFECGDCNSSEPYEEDDGSREPSLCTHAVAVALAAVDADAVWYEIPRDSQRPPIPRPLGWDAKRIQGTLLDVLGDGDAQHVLRQLIQQHPEHVSAAEQAALRHLDRDSKVWAYNTTRNALRAFDPAQVAIYEDPTKGELTADFADEDIDDDGVVKLEADQVLLAYGMRPIIREMTKRASAGAFQGSRSVLFGLIEGLYSCHDEAPWTEPEITDHVGDLLYAVAVAALWAYSEWAERPSADDLRRHCEGWADRLLRDVA